VDFPEITGSAIYCEDEPTGAIDLLADRASGTIVGGWILSPAAGETIGSLTSAIRAQTPIETRYSTRTAVRAA
jgi:pyruvate/2-oxoglutarate dehydrogenase complex dihydrolipoamide dehydrogenase (E3) component